MGKLRRQKPEDLESASYCSDICPILPPVDALLMEGVTLTQDAQQLNGSERAVLDGLLSPAECGVLLQLAKVHVMVCGSATCLGTRRLSRLLLAFGCVPPRTLPVSSFS